MTKDIFYFYHNNGLGWFRLFGVGLEWKDTSLHSLTFTERRFNKGIRIGRYIINYLPYSK